MINAGVNSKKKIVLISSGQPSLNPRLVKEADALAENGYDVLVIYAYWNDWGTRIDDQTLPKKKWKAIRAGGHPVQKPLVYLISRIIFKIANFAVNILGLICFADWAVARSSFFLSVEAKKHNADMFIGHNLGALPAIVKAAKKFNKPCGFDAEDLHRYEVCNDDADTDVKLKSWVENKYIPQTDYLTVSSDQIGEAYQQIFKDKLPVTILNVFPRSNNIVIPLTNDGKCLKLFWFSQTIGAKRGLDDIINALKTFDICPFELNLLGDIPSAVQKTYIESLTRGVSFKVNFYAPMPPDELTVFASQFDIGLALEPGFCTNNDRALSNKIFTYLSAGLAVITSDTTAQEAFLQRYPGIGEIYKKKDALSLTEILNYYYQNRDALIQSKRVALSLAREKLNWENESVKFLKIVKQTINQVS